MTLQLIVKSVIVFVPTDRLYYCTKTEDYLIG